MQRPVCCAFLFIIGFCFQTWADGVVDRFLAAPDYKTSEGFVCFQDNRAGFPTGAYFRVLWARGDFIQEITRPAKSGSELTNPAEVEFVYAAEGRYRGTNWSFRDSSLTIAGDLTDNAKLLQSRLQGLTPEEFSISTLLGRGFTLRDLKTMVQKDAATVAGKYDLKIPIICHFQQTNDHEIRVDFALQRASGTAEYTRYFLLRPFSSSTFIPGYLKSYKSLQGKVEIFKDITITYSTNSIFGVSLSPWGRYHTTELLFRNKGRLYIMTTNHGNVPIRKKDELAMQKPSRVWLVRILLGLSIAILGWVLYRQIRLSLATKQQTKKDYESEN